MGASVAVQVIPQGLLVPRSEIDDWLERGVEAVRDGEQIIIRPKTELTERERVIRILEEAGLLAPIEPLPPDHIPVSEDEREELARKFSMGRPLSEIVIEERDERW